MPTVSFQNGTDDHHVVLLRFLLTKGDRWTGFDLFGKRCPVLFPGAEGKGHRPCLLETQNVDLRLSSIGQNSIHMIQNSLSASVHKQ